MPRKTPKTQSAAILPVSAGKKKVFGDDDDQDDTPAFDFEASRKRAEEDQEEDDEDSEDDDEAPEAVGLAVGKDEARLAEEERSAALQLKKKARAEKSAKIQAAREAQKAAEEAAKQSKKAGKVKAKAKKAVIEVPEEEDVSDVEDLEDDVDVEDDIDMDGSEGESFHSDDEDDNDDGDEDLDMDMDIAADPETRRLHARMQAAMEASEAKASGKATSSKSTSMKKQKSSDATVETPSSGLADDGSEYDMGPMMLPASVLTAAAASEARKRKLLARKADLARAEEARRARRKSKRADVEPKQRKVNNKTTVHLLPTSLSAGGLPPIVRARTQLSAKSVSEKFIKGAMQRSGVQADGKTTGKRSGVSSLASSRTKGPAGRFER